MFKNKKIAAVILAAGNGNRFKSAVPKQFLRFGNKEVLLHTLKHFLLCDFLDYIIIVVSPEWLKRAQKMVLKLSKDKRIYFVTGGKTRKQSNFNALKFLKNKNMDYVLFHDAVRPFISRQLITLPVLNALKYGAAILSPEVSDLPARIKNGFVVEVSDPKLFLTTQTPECYRFDIIWKAHQLGRENKKLVKATNLELMLNFKNTVKGKIKVIRHKERNIKLTFPSDMFIASKLLRQ